VTAETIEVVVDYYLSGLGVSDERQAAIAASFEHDLDVLADFSKAVTEIDITDWPFWQTREETATKFGPQPRHRWSAAFLLHAPVVFGRSPREAEAREWATEFLDRYSHVFGKPRPPVARILSEAQHLADGGVPLHYLRAFHPTEARTAIPVDEILSYWNAGIPVEYALILRNGHG
jgi:hypothetical protein